ncbi:MAG: hypothetical protein JWP12_1850 [Bacteroidetes bacterium]|nr:hypothetical protein [Bacteroidota bacterium]
MSNLLNSYPIFENNQVLTSSQLNSLVAYLDEQNRLTRVKLIGDGIVCGFDLKLTQTPINTEITIFQGVGITSEGFLIIEGDAVTHNYRKYDLPAGVRYVPFEDPATTVQDVLLYELLTDDAPTLPTDVIIPLSSPFINDKVVLLFIELIDVDNLSCLAKSCDDTGETRMFNLRKLLITKTDLKKVIARTCAQTSSFPGKYDLPEIFLQRALFKSVAENFPPNPNTVDYFSFSKTYINAISAPALPAGTGPTYTQLLQALQQTYVDFSPILADQYNGVNPFINMPAVPDWSKFVNGTLTPGPQYLGMQYFYDFIKDLILAYNEFRDVAFDLMSECCNDMDCFPQHLMLGEVIPTGSDKPSPFRNYFISSPLFNNQTEKLNRAVSLFQRMVLMTQSFDLTLINNPPTTVIAPNPLPVPIYITPSNEKRDFLSKRAIPYYYRIHETHTTLGTLEQSWNYEYKRKALFSQGLTPLAYGNQDFNQAAIQGPIKTPLYYDLDPYNFLRIEGHLRSNVVDVQTELDKIKHNFDLPFNVVALRLAGDPIDDITKRCDFNDLRTQYTTLRIELLGLRKFTFDRFGTLVNGQVRGKALPQFLKSFIADIDTGILSCSILQPQIGVVTLRDVVIAPDGTTTAQPAEAQPLPDRTNASANAAANTVPVYAPQRTLTQVKEKLTSDGQDLLEALNALKNDLPFNMNDFKLGYTGTVQDSTPGFLQDYFTAMQAAIDVKVGLNQLMDIIVRTTKIKNTPELYFDLTAYINELGGVLESFISDVRFASLTLLSYTLQYRINYLKTHDMTLFSNFIKKHPGIEHKAGVHPGDTFVLLTPGNSVAINPIKRKLVIEQTRDLKALNLQIEQIKAQPVISVQDKQIIDNNNAKILNYGLIAQEIALPAIPIQKFAIDAHQVIADFTLPYLCCCDCECDEIPVPKAAEDLNMPTFATPFYAEYSLGDYAFGKDIHVGSRTLEGVTIDIVPMLQYDKNLYQPSQIRLYVVDKFGNKVVFNQVVPPVDVAMATGNYPNVPTYKATSGAVSIPANSDKTRAQYFVYSPLDEQTQIPVVDSFYYMFEIVSNEGGTVISRSSMGKVTVTICV